MYGKLQSQLQEELSDIKEEGLYKKLEYSLLGNCSNEIERFETVYKFIQNSFFYGYLATQILGGWLADRYGGKVVLGAGVLLWSFFTLITFSI